MKRIHQLAEDHVELSRRYDIRCRTIDENGVAQPMPRPFPKSGRNAIQTLTITAEA